MNADDVLALPGGPGGAFAAFATTGPDPAKLERTGRDRESVAQGFEELLLAMFVKEIRQTSGVQLFGETTGAHLLEALFDERLASSLAQAGGIGIGERLVEHLPGDDAPRARTPREPGLSLQPVHDGVPLAERTRFEPLAETFHGR